MDRHQRATRQGRHVLAVALNAWLASRLPLDSKYEFTTIKTPTMFNLRFLSLCFLALVLIPLGCSSDGASSNGQPPTVSITSPEDGAILNTDRVTVEGTATNTDTVDVNGVLADVVDGTWTALVPVDEGEVTVVATAGDATDEVTFSVDSFAPELVILSPERGEYVDSETVTVSGTVSEDGTGLSFVEYGGQRIDVDANGNFSIDVTVREGVNRIKVTAQDLAGNEAAALRAVVYGPTTDPTEVINPAFTVFVRDEALAVVEQVIENLITPEFVTDLATQNLAIDNVNLDAVRFDPIDVVIDPDDNVINLSLSVTNAEVEGSFTIGSEVFPTTIQIVKFDIQLELRVSAAPDGGIAFNFGEPVLNLAEEDLLFNVQDLTQDDAQFLRNLIVDVATQAFGQLLNEALFEELFDPDILKRRIEILGRELVFEVAFEEITVFSDGILARLSVSMPQEQFAGVRDVPGALNIPPGNPQGPNTENDIIFTTTRNAMDRILHGVWRSGLLHQELRGDDFGSVELPIQLNSNALGLLIDQRISTLAGDNVPAGITLRPLLPPFLELREGGGLGINISELLIDLKLLPPGGDEVLIATIAVFIDLEVNIGIDGVEVNLTFDAQAQADLDAEPEIDLNDAKAEDLLTGLVALIPSALSDGLTLDGVADIEWISLESPAIEVHGVETDHASVSLSMAPAEPAAPE